VLDTTDALRDNLNNMDIVDRTSDRGSIAFAARSAHDAILGARAEVQAILQDYIAGGIQNAPPPTDMTPPPTDLTPPFQQSFRISQSEINRGQRDINRAFTQLTNAYSRAFNSSLHSIDGTGGLANGFNDQQVDLLNQRLFRVISRLPFGVQNVGPSVLDTTDALRDNLNNMDIVDRTSDRGSIAFAAGSAHDAIQSARAEVQAVLQDYILSGVDDGSFVIR
jgi:hypothetical protein